MEVSVKSLLLTVALTVSSAQLSADIINVRDFTKGSLSCTNIKIYDANRNNVVAEKLRGLFEEEFRANVEVIKGEGLPPTIWFDGQVARADFGARRFEDGAIVLVVKGDGDFTGRDESAELFVVDSTNQDGIKVLGQAMREYTFGRAGSDRMMFMATNLVRQHCIGSFSVN